MDGRNTGEQRLIEPANGPGNTTDQPRVAYALEAALGTLREQLAQERDRVRMADRRAELAERRADRAEAAFGSELARVEELRRQLAAAEARARGVGALKTRIDALLMERIEADALAAAALQTAERLQQAVEVRSLRTRRLGRLLATLIGLGLVAWP